MNLSNKRKLVFTLMILSLFIVSGLSGCSKEAKKAKHWKRGEKYYSENKFREAIIEYKNVLQLDPKDATCRYKLGLSHLRTGQFREAFSEFSKSVELNQDLVEAPPIGKFLSSVERQQESQGTGGAGSRKRSE